MLNVLGLINSQYNTIGTKCIVLQFQLRFEMIRNKQIEQRTCIPILIPN